MVTRFNDVPVTLDETGFNGVPDHLKGTQFIGGDCGADYLSQAFLQ
ncbi:hypothetical protein Q8A64_12355 [Oxalobacteraceae bacterium R-40]|uniref:Transposase n=1 Tax=Keguizhuia sedimenti TaxID=3064264 RepID=A0ABU1BQA8_9BURK|nr:hypothetical protein [Oxalobacteraceae bacterium R-40]